MQEHAFSYQKPLVTWMLIADGRQAQIYECHKAMQKIPLGGVNKHHYYDKKSGHTLVEVSDGALVAESIDDYHIGHDRRGTTSSSNSPTHNTYEPHGDIERELKRRFARLIADKLQRAYMEKAFDRLLLVAPAKMIGELKEELASDVQNRIVAILPKDLTHYHGQELMTHLKDILKKSHAIG